MYWLPAIFIVIELMFINVLDKLLRFQNVKILLDKYKSRELETYIKTEFAGVDKLTVFLGIFLFFEFIYFIVAFFYPFWIVSAFFIGYSIISTIISKLKKKSEFEIEKTIKIANLNGFETTDVKLARLLKLNELKGSEIKTKTWQAYIFPVLKIIVFSAIIILHYNYKIL